MFHSVTVDCIFSSDQECLESCSQCVSSHSAQSCHLILVLGHDTYNYKHLAGSIALLYYNLQVWLQHVLWRNVWSMVTMIDLIHYIHVIIWTLSSLHLHIFLIIWTLLSSLHLHIFLTQQMLQFITMASGQSCTLADRNKCWNEKH